MATIGFATLQILPSLKGVTEEIEKQVAGKTISVDVTPKVDQRATEQAAKKTRETVEKQTTQVKVEPKVDQRAAERAGKATGEAVSKGANEAVRKGDIGGTVSDEIRGQVERKSPGRELGKILVDGIADGVKGELRGGPLGDQLINSVADSVKRGIDSGSAGKISDAITGGIKSGNLTGKLRDAVLGSVQQVGTEIRSSTAEWGRNIADSLRSGDIEGATGQISTAVLNTTDLIAGIGETFGLQLGDVREFGQNAATTLGGVGSDVQDVINNALNMKSTFTDTGTLLANVLPDRARSGAQSIIGSLGTIIPIATTVYEALDRITKNWHDEQEEKFWQRWAEDQRARDHGLKPPQPGVGDFGGPPAVGQGDSPTRPAPAPVSGDVAAGIRAQIAAGSLPGFSIGPNGDIIGPDGTPFKPPGFGAGGFTGNWVRDQVAGVVHGGEWVINADSTQRIESAWPGFLEHLNKTGKLPGYEGGGLVAGSSQLRDIIMRRFGIPNIGGYRPGGDGYNEHVTGRALDVMVGNDKAKGDAVKDWVLANADAVDLKWVIWRKHLFYPGGGGYDMDTRPGGPTANHMDHVHIFSGTGITNGLRGALAGGVGSSGGKALVQNAIKAPGAIDPASTDQTASSSAAATPASAGGSGGPSGGSSVPTSLSGLSRWGFDNLVAGADNREGHRDANAYFPKAAASAIGDQVSSALGVLGVGDSPGWLQGISKLVSGISVSDKGTGQKLFDGSNIGASFGGGDKYGGAAPVPAGAGQPATPPDLSGVHGNNAGRPPGPTYSPTFNTNDDTAFQQWLNWQNAESAAQTNRW